MTDVVKSLLAFTSSTGNTAASALSTSARRSSAMIKSFEIIMLSSTLPENAAVSMSTVACESEYSASNTAEID